MGDTYGVSPTLSCGSNGVSLLTSTVRDTIVPRDRAHAGAWSIPWPLYAVVFASTCIVIGQIDWEDFKRVVSGDGPCNVERIEHRRTAHEDGAWVREAAISYANKQAARTKSSAA